MKAGKLTLIIVIIAAPLAWWGTQQYGASDNGLPSLHTEQAHFGDVSQRVLAHGTLQPVQKVIVGSQVSGIIDEILVDFNSMVEHGQVIAQLDPTTFRAEVSSAEAELESAEAALELAQFQWQRVQELRERQFVSPSDVDEARSNLRQAEAQVKVRRHSLERAQRELDRTTIKSPTDGMVVSRNVDVGQTVAASLSAPELFEIASDLSQMLIHANVSEADIGMVFEGQNTVFRVDAYREREFEGEIIQVRNSPIVEDNVVHYETIIAVDNEEQLLKPGMTAEVSIIADERQNVLRLRNSALRARIPDNLRPEEPEDIGENEGIAYLVENDRLRAVKVQTGLNDGVHTEILGGIEEGDTLAVGLTLQTNGDNNNRSLMRGNQAQY